MLQFVAETIIDTGMQAVGWAVLKGITFGRYRGFRPEDILFEGTVGFVVLAAVFYGGYRLLL
jgi:hypothetical protein